MNQRNTEFPLHLASSKRFSRSAEFCTPNRTRSQFERQSAPPPSKKVRGVRASGCRLGSETLDGAGCGALILPHSSCSWRASSKLGYGSPVGNRLAIYFPQAVVS